jgi:ADP-ribose pyrophosphatase YjhB (NUDIX family)
METPKPRVNIVSIIRKNGKVLMMKRRDDEGKEIW